MVKGMSIACHGSLLAWVGGEWMGLFGTDIALEETKIFFFFCKIGQSVV